MANEDLCAPVGAPSHCEGKWFAPVAGIFGMLGPRNDMVLNVLALGLGLYISFLCLSYHKVANSH
jgi:hypothetical protein